MWRFYLAATAIVATIVLGLSLRQSTPRDFTIEGKPTGTPTVTKALGNDGLRSPIPLAGDAPWAFSALPNCVVQHRRVRGDRSVALALIPPGARDAGPGPLHLGACDVTIASDGIHIVRGEDRLRVPAPARMVRLGDTFYLETRRGSSFDVRSFTAVKN